jgi:oligopeptide/dipeptide ABC transporter ATP-binding protein
MEKVGLAPRLKYHLPYAFSGGQRQRISIARALSVNPAFIVADEPTSALDVSIQAQILKLLIQLQDEMNLTYLFISHDLSVVRYISHRIAVMYLGQIVELADADSLFSTPFHPYAKALLAAVPLPDPESKSSTEAIAGDLPHPSDKIAGCRFYSRCAEALDICAQTDPDMYLPAKNHAVRCFLYKQG